MATLIQCIVVWYEKLEFLMRSAVCSLLSVCLLLAILRDIASLIHCKVVRYEKLRIIYSFSCLFTISYLFIFCSAHFYWLPQVTERISLLLIRGIPATQSVVEYHDMPSLSLSKSCCSFNKYTAWSITSVARFCIRFSWNFILQIISRLVDRAASYRIWMELPRQLVTKPCDWGDEPPCRYYGLFRTLMKRIIWLT